MDPLRRRQFVVGAGAAGLSLLAACGRLPWQAPSTPAARHLAFMIGGTATSDVVYIEAFREQLRQHGWDLDRQVAIEYRYAEGRPERLPAFATEFVDLQVDIIVTGGLPATRAAQNATRTIP